MLMVEIEREADGRWLAEVVSGGRAICRDCKVEVSVRSTR